MAHAEGTAAVPLPMSAPAPADAMVVTLVFASAARQVQTLALRLPAAATARDALQAGGWAATLEPRLGDDGPDGLHLALWGRACAPDAVLQHGDRLELLRPLQQDPMLARRQRLQRDGLRKPQRRGAKHVKKTAPG